VADIPIDPRISSRRTRRDLLVFRTRTRASRCQQSLAVRLASFRGWRTRLTFPGIPKAASPQGTRSGENQGRSCRRGWARYPLGVARNTNAKATNTAMRTASAPPSGAPAVSSRPRAFLRLLKCSVVDQPAVHTGQVAASHDPQITQTIRAVLRTALLGPCSRDRTDGVG
jgi:hypothetical protein